MIEPSRIATAETAPAPPPLRVVDAAVAPPRLTRTVKIDGTREPQGWRLETNRKRAEAILERLEVAISKGRGRLEEKLRGEFLAVVHQDRIANVCLIARDEELRLEPIGHGHLIDRTILYRLRRTPWRVRPLVGAPDRSLPVEAYAAHNAWTSHEGAFDAYYECVEIPRDLAGATAPAEPVFHAFLVGVLSSDDVTGDWFVLDRWTR